MLPRTTIYGNHGYIGAWLCGADGAFSPIPTITVRFSRSWPDVIPGLTITWGSAYGEYASRFRVTAYHGERAIFSRTAGNTSVDTILTGDIAGYDKLVLEILQWSVPHRRARMKNLYLGIAKTYTKADIMHFSCTHTVEPLSGALPRSEISFEIKNPGGEYNPDNPGGEYNPDNPGGEAKYLMERQQVTVRYGCRVGGGTEWIPGGVYYLSEWVTPQNGITASFTARDALEFMGGQYTGPSSGTLYAIAEAALRQAGLPKLPDGSDRWQLSQSLKQASAPPDADLSGASVAEVLQYAANAGCCVFFQDREGVLRMEPMQTAVSDYRIGRFNSYAYADIRLLKPLRTVNINNGQYILKAGLDGEEQPVRNPLISDGQAETVARWVASLLENRRILDGEFRIDPRLDPLDIVRNENRFSNSAVLVTSVGMEYNGAFRGSYEGRAINGLISDNPYSGEIFSGEW